MILVSHPPRPYIGTLSASLESSWILMSYLLQCSRTGSNLLCEVLCSLLLITDHRLLPRFLVLWPWRTLFFVLFARTLLSVLYLSSTKACSSKFFTLQMGSRTNTVSIDHLKPVHGPNPVPQQPPQQGRPPRPATDPVPVLPAAPPRWNPLRRAHTTASSSLSQR